MNERLDAHQQSLTYCHFCPKLCLQACPVSTADGREAHVPQVKMDDLWHLDQGQQPWIRELTTAIYACTGCLRCQTYCAHGIDVPTPLQIGRSLARENGAGHPALENFAARFHRDSERTVASMRKRSARLATSGTWALFPGCDALDLIDPTLATLDAIGIAAVIADAPFSSAGHTLLAAGCRDEFARVAAASTHATANFANLVFNCPGCMLAFKTTYRDFGHVVTPQIFHTSQVVARHLPTLQRRPAERRWRNILYHDACLLGRALGIYDEPRQIVAWATDSPLEFFNARHDGICSGAGNLLWQTHPVAADEIAMQRLQIAHALGATTLVTGCPTSRRLFRKAARSSAPAGRPSIVIMDIVEMLAP